MNILVDENIPVSVVEVLREEGHDVRDLRGTDLEGSTDRYLWKLAQHEGRIFITTDNDFKALRRTPHHGLLIVTLRRPNRVVLTRRILDVMHRFEPTDWRNTTVSARDSAAVVWSPELSPDQP